MLWIYQKTKIKNVAKDILEIWKSFASVKSRFASSNFNRAAHRLDKFSFEWVRSYPNWNDDGSSFGFNEISFFQ